MKSTLFTLGALAAAVTAQDIASLPACGVSTNQRQQTQVAAS